MVTSHDSLTKSIPTKSCVSLLDLLEVKDTTSRTSAHLLDRPDVNTECQRHWNDVLALELSRLGCPMEDRRLSERSQIQIPRTSFRCQQLRSISSRGVASSLLKRVSVTANEKGL